jgi:hypothetical protein
MATGQIPSGLPPKTPQAAAPAAPKPGLTRAKGFVAPSPTSSSTPIAAPFDELAKVADAAQLASARHSIGNTVVFDTNTVKILTATPPQQTIPPLLELAKPFEIILQDLAQLTDFTKSNEFTEKFLNSDAVKSFASKIDLYWGTRLEASPYNPFQDLRFWKDCVGLIGKYIDFCFHQTSKVSREQTIFQNKLLELTDLILTLSQNIPASTREEAFKYEYIVRPLHHFLLDFKIDLIEGDSVRGNRAILKLQLDNLRAQTGNIVDHLSERFPKEVALRDAIMAFGKVYNKPDLSPFEKTVFKPLGFQSKNDKGFDKLGGYYREFSQGNIQYIDSIFSIFPAVITAYNKVISSPAAIQDTHKPFVNSFVNMVQSFMDYATSKVRSDGAGLKEISDIIRTTFTLPMDRLLEVMVEPVDILAIASDSPQKQELYGRIYHTFTSVLQGLSLVAEASSIAAKIQNSTAVMVDMGDGARGIALIRSGSSVEHRFPARLIQPALAREIEEICEIRGIPLVQYGPSERDLLPSLSSTGLETSTSGPDATITTSVSESDLARGRTASTSGLASSGSESTNFLTRLKSTRFPGGSKTEESGRDRTQSSVSQRARSVSTVDRLPIPDSCSVVQQSILTTYNALKETKEAKSFCNQEYVKWFFSECKERSEAPSFNEDIHFLINFIQVAKRYLDFLGENPKLSTGLSDTIFTHAETILNHLIAISHNSHDQLFIILNELAFSKANKDASEKGAAIFNSALSRLQKPLLHIEDILTEKIPNTFLLYKQAVELNSQCVTIGKGSGLLGALQEKYTPSFKQIVLTPLKFNDPKICPTLVQQFFEHLAVNSAADKLMNQISRLYIAIFKWLGQDNVTPSSHDMECAKLLLDFADKVLGLLIDQKKDDTYGLTILAKGLTHIETNKGKGTSEPFKETENRISHLKASLYARAFVSGLFLEMPKVDEAFIDKIVKEAFSGGKTVSDFTSQLSALCIDEISDIIDPATLFRGNSLVTKVLKELGEKYAAFYNGMFEEIVTQAKSSGNLEINPDKANASQDAQEILARQNELQRLFIHTVNTLVLQTQTLPDEVKDYVAIQVNALLKAAKPEHKNNMLNFVFGGFFLRAVSPWFVNKVAALVITGDKTDKFAAATCLLMSKFIQTGANRAQFGVKEKHLAPFNPIVKDAAPIMWGIVFNLLPAALKDKILAEIPQTAEKIAAASVNPPLLLQGTPIIESSSQLPPEADEDAEGPTPLPAIPELPTPRLSEVLPTAPRFSMSLTSFPPLPPADSFHPHPAAPDTPLPPFSHDFSQMSSSSSSTTENLMVPSSSQMSRTSSTDSYPEWLGSGHPTR